MYVRFICLATALMLVGCESKPVYTPGKIYKIPCEYRGEIFPYFSKDELNRVHSREANMHLLRNDLATYVLPCSDVKLIYIDDHAVMLQDGPFAGWIHRFQWEETHPVEVDPAKSNRKY